MIKINDILKIIQSKKKNPNSVVCGYSSIDPVEAKSVNIPKVVINQNNQLIYMSRSLIPGAKKNSIKEIFLNKFAFMLLIKKN